jgi:hypothetical protein
MKTSENNESNNNAKRIGAGAVKILNFIGSASEEKMLIRPEYRPIKFKNFTGTGTGSQKRNNNLY